MNQGFHAFQVQSINAVANAVSSIVQADSNVYDQIDTIESGANVVPMTLGRYGHYPKKGPCPAIAAATKSQIARQKITPIK
jgi:hypothetical protein